ncbi:unnamed protein product [Scytosiphon promiscuus]
MAPTDRDALVALYNSTGGPTWYLKENWNTDKDLSLWHGVEILQGDVVNLDLSENNLRGMACEGRLIKRVRFTIRNHRCRSSPPPEVAQESHESSSIGLGSAKSGPIPPELGKLGALKKLELRSSKLSGLIPAELGNLTAVETLDFGDNELSGAIPRDLGQLIALVELHLGRNHLSGSVPPELGKLGTLQRLLLHDNELSGPIPPELGKAAALTSLELQNNQLTEIASEVLELCRGSLKETGLNDNPWSRPPSTVLESGYESALGWWEDLKRFGAGKSNKLKMVLVGLAEAGKTTIVRHLTGGSVPRPVDRTVGIEITPDWKPFGSAPLQVSIWDFAGQADYYSSHQLFLTKGALFLLVVNLRAFFEEMLESGVDNFTDPSGRIYWWLEMLHMRVPGAAIALVGSHVDQMQRADAVKAAIDLHTVVSNFILHKAENASRQQRNLGIGSESTTAGQENGQSSHKQVACGGSSVLQSGSERFPFNPSVLHERVFQVSLKRATTSELRQWISKAAYGQECPRGFDFPAVDQTVSQAWIEAYDAMDALKETASFVLWSKAVEEYSTRMVGRLSDPDDPGKILLRAMRHREAEGGVLLSLVDASAPAANDMLYLTPSWLIELVRRLVDHNLVDRRKRGTLEQGLRSYAQDQRLRARPLIDMQRAYCKSGHLDKAYLRFLWMHRKMDPPTTPVVMTDSEFESIILMMTRLLVMYQCPGADHLVVPARLGKYGDQRILDPGNIGESVVKVQCSFGQKYPPPGIVGRFLAWLTEKIDNYGHCWLHGAFFSYSSMSRGNAKSSFMSRTTRSTMTMKRTASLLVSR